MISVYGHNGQFETEALKRRLKSVTYTYYNLNEDYNLDWFKATFKSNVPVVVMSNQVLTEAQISNLINGIVETQPGEPGTQPETKETKSQSVQKRPNNRNKKGES